MEYESGLSPLANLRLCKTPTPTLLSVPARKLSWSAESSSSTPRRDTNRQTSSPRRVTLTARGNLFRRLNSAPSPTCQILAKADKENHDSSPLLIAGKADRAPLEEQDTNSQDSGCCDAPDGAQARFAVPSGLPPRKGVDPPSSPGKCWYGEDHASFTPGSSIRSPPSFRAKSMRSLSFCSTDSFDDGFSELVESSENKTDEKGPLGFGSLLTGLLRSANTNDSCCISTSPQRPRPPQPSSFNFNQPPRRAFSMVENIENNAKSSAKRPNEVNGCGGLLKKRKPSVPYDVQQSSASPARHRLQRSASENCATLLSSTLSNLYGRPELIADFSRAYALPVVAGKHSDLTSISVETLAALMRNEFGSSVRTYTVIDCRYPYEFEGGHIKGACNLYTCEQVEDALLKNMSLTPSGNGVPGSSSGSDILIFHCEFSVARGPSMYRWLRRLDRSSSAYPSLQYPEVYLLDGGYCSFYKSFPALCQPHGYTPMHHPTHQADLRKFRSKSTSWTASRASFKRLQLL